MPGEAQRIVNVIGQVVSKNTANGARIQYTPAVVHDGSGAYAASAYVWVEEFLEDIIVPAGDYVAAGDYVVLGISDEGKAWIDRILPTSLYAKMVIDYNRGRIGFGDGTEIPEDFGTLGDALLSGGPGASAYWGAGGGGGGGVTDHGALTGLGDDDHTIYLKEKASGGVASEVPTHTHADAANAGTLSHADLTNLTTGDPHTQYAGQSEFDDHSARHENGGADEISIAGLDGTPVELTNHLNDTSDAHDASAVSIADSGNNFASSDVEGALTELASGVIIGTYPPSMRVYMWTTFK